jgi:hypothetical protein
MLSPPSFYWRISGFDSLFSFFRASVSEAKHYKPFARSDIKLNLDLLTVSLIRPLSRRFQQHFVRNNIYVSVSGLQ